MEINDDVQKANLLNRAFAAEFPDADVPFIPDVPFTTDIVITNFHVWKDVVRRVLQELVVSKACGPDGLSAHILRECASQLSVPLCTIVRSSISKGVFPVQWTEANGVPIFKRGSRKILQTVDRFLYGLSAPKFLRKKVSDQLYEHVKLHLSTPARFCSPQILCIKPGMLFVSRVDGQTGESSAGYDFHSFL